MKNKQSFSTFLDYFNLHSEETNYLEAEFNNVLTTANESLSNINPTSSVYKDYYFDVKTNIHTSTLSFVNKLLKEINSNKFNIESNTNLSVGTKVALLKFVNNYKPSTIDVKKFKDNEVEIDSYMKFNNRLHIYNKVINIISSIKPILMEPLSSHEYSGELSTLIHHMKNNGFVVKELKAIESYQYTNIVDIQPVIESSKKSLDVHNYNPNDIYRFSKEILVLNDRIKKCSDELFNNFTSTNKNEIIELVYNPNIKDTVNEIEAIKIRLAKLAFIVNLQHSVLGYSFNSDSYLVKSLCDIIVESSK